MVSHRVAPRAATLFCLAVPLFVFVACGKRTPEPSKKQPAEITLPESASQAAFDQIEKDLAQFESGPLHNAKCEGCLAPVTIHSTGLTKDIKGSSGPAKMRIVALIHNTSRQAVDHIPSRTTFKANTKYLMWVNSGADKKAVWGFIELGPAYTPRPKAIGHLENCVHNPPVTPTTTDDANFYSCDDVYASRGWINSAYASPPQASASISKPGWIACDPDCCTGTTK